MRCYILCSFTSLHSHHIIRPVDEASYPVFTPYISAAFVKIMAYRQISNISRTLIGNKIVDHSEVVGASPVGAAPTTSSFST